MIRTRFQLKKTKITTSVGLKRYKQKISRPHEAIFDSGSTVTVMSESLFKKLGYPIKDPGNVKVIGINGESKGISTIIDYFEIGGVNLGSVRVVIGNLHPNFENSIILGMNILLWYDFAVSHFNKSISLVERKWAGNFDASARFTMKDITNVNLAAFEEIEEN